MGLKFMLSDSLALPRFAARQRKPIPDLNRAVGQFFEYAGYKPVVSHQDVLLLDPETHRIDARINCRPQEGCGNGGWYHLYPSGYLMSDQDLVPAVKKRCYTSVLRKAGQRIIRHFKKVPVLDNQDLKNYQLRNDITVKSPPNVTRSTDIINLTLDCKKVAIALEGHYTNRIIEKLTDHYGCTRGKSSIDWKIGPIPVDNFRKKVVTRRWPSLQSVQIGKRKP
jgi:hypothetical protein